MIITETFSKNETTYKKTFSDSNKYIKKVGTDELYTVAIDIQDFEYIETENEIPQVEEKTQENSNFNPLFINHEF